MTLQEIADRLRAVSETPLLDARLLLAHGGDIEANIRRRLAHEPVSKIIGRRGFWKSDFITTKDVLDPRPDSETIIEAVLKNYPDKGKPYRILDIGTGSGCLLFSVLDEYPNATGIGLDISEKALSVAEQNRQGRSATLIKADLYAASWTKDLGEFDIVLSNPPYIPTDELSGLAPDVRLYDPKEALDGGADGLNAYRTLAQKMKGILASGGKAFLEVGQGQADTVRELGMKNGLTTPAIYRDFGGIDRVVVWGKI